MPLVILDGPEAAGKSTIIDALTAEWGPESHLESWGPKDSWLEYCAMLHYSTTFSKKHPQFLIVWSRCWASRTVYNKLLEQGQIIPSCVTAELDQIVIRSGGFLGMVTAPVTTLLERRLARIAEGNQKPDHQLDVRQELAEFQKYGRNRGWTGLSGTDDINYNVRWIINSLVLRNPECRMSTERIAVTE